MRQQNVSGGTFASRTLPSKMKEPSSKIHVRPVPVRVRPPQRFEGNTIGGDLECEDNAHAPTGGGNQVSGERKGQCAGL